MAYLLSQAQTCRRTNQQLNNTVQLVGIASLCTVKVFVIGNTSFS